MLYQFSCSKLSSGLYIFLPLLYDGVDIICNEFGISLRKKFYNILLEGQCLGTSKK